MHFLTYRSYPLHEIHGHFVVVSFQSIQEIGTKNDEVLMARSGGQALAPSHNSDPTTVTQSMMTKVAHAVRSQKSRKQGGGGRVDEVGGDVAQQKKTQSGAVRR